MRYSRITVQVFSWYDLNTVSEDWFQLAISRKGAAQIDWGKTGVKPDQVRKFSAHFEKAESTLNDSRAAHIHRKNLIYDEDDGEEG